MSISLEDSSDLLPELSSDNLLVERSHKLENFRAFGRFKIDFSDSII